MSDEEVATLQDELAEARAELERLQTVVADREARALHLEEVSAAMRQELSASRDELGAARAELSARDDRIDGLDGDLAVVRGENEELHARLQAAVGKYREGLLAAAPELPAEMVQGSSVEEVEASIDRARDTVLKVRERLESQTQAARVPAGSPPRQQPDLSALSPAEKIRLGLARK